MVSMRQIARDRYGVRYAGAAELVRCEGGRDRANEACKIKLDGFDTVQRTDSEIDVPGHEQPIGPAAPVDRFAGVEIAVGNLEYVVASAGTDAIGAIAAGDRVRLGRSG